MAPRPIRTHYRVLTCVTPLRSRQFPHTCRFTEMSYTPNTLLPLPAKYPVPLLRVRQYLAARFLIPQTAKSRLFTFLPLRAQRNSFIIGADMPQTGSIGFSLKDSSVSDMSKTQKSIIADLVKHNPTASLAEIAKMTIELTALATCPVRITESVLRQLGYTDPPNATPKPLGVTTDTPNDGGAGPSPAHLTSVTIRRQLEERHNKIQEWFTEFLTKETISDKDIKVFQSFSMIDEKLITQLLELMNEDAAPLLPLGILVGCLRELGVSEDDIAFVQDI